MKDESGNRLGSYLRARRELITPAQAGIPPGGNRRVPGLRREEVALLAGISPDYYLRLERGRDKNPSPQVLESLARVLQLDDIERTYLLGLAAARPRAPRRKRPEHVPARVHELLAHLPIPAFVEGRAFDVLASNPMAVALSPACGPGRTGFAISSSTLRNRSSTRTGRRPPPISSPPFARPSGTTPTTPGSSNSSESSPCPVSGSVPCGPATKSAASTEAAPRSTTPSSVTYTSTATNSPSRTSSSSCTTPTRTATATRNYGSSPDSHTPSPPARRAPEAALEGVPHKRSDQFCAGGGSVAAGEGGQGAVVGAVGLAWRRSLTFWDSMPSRSAVIEPNSFGGAAGSGCQRRWVPVSSSEVRQTRWASSALRRRE